MVELLVVLAVVGLLIALTMPAIGYARKRSQQTTCSNHLRQFGVALQNHQSQFGFLPEDGQNGFGYGTLLLPFLEQDSLYDRISPLKTHLSSRLRARPGIEDSALAIFRCPSHRGSPQLQVSRFGRSNYIGTSDLFATSFSLAHVRDGESNTLAVGETTTDQGWALPGTGNCNAPPNSGGRYSSAHTGGAFFLFCDGAVRLLSDHIDASTFRSLGTPAGDEAIGKF